MELRSKVWMITGISSGIGKALFEEVVSGGDFVIGTFRHADQVEAFKRRGIKSTFAVQMDLSQPTSIQRACDTIKENFNRIDVLVNNAGYGFTGAVEEASLEEIVNVFSVNFFAPHQILKNILPVLREQRSGHIIQMSSHGGFKAMPGFGIYNASKFAFKCR